MSRLRSLRLSQTLSRIPHHPEPAAPPGHRLHLAILSSIDILASARPGRSPACWALVGRDVGTVAILLAATNICFAGATP
ncbi:hypothetical protein CC77DRAFT_428608 [Alternaria alternata]|uniref:Uncharacterized protein n=1 Tax=Alternaria alternata TaxID=5599 RepID=A0A177D9L1_ALTAL|nr:hypothetical protein CC77DRAFT_428608 [Alternaria alternata]OAG16138.1 hypothetical protein CC77DRAFT_428608 [Alternaria alternata]